MIDSRIWKPKIQFLKIQRSFWKPPGYAPALIDIVHTALLHTRMHAFTQNSYYIAFVY